jgi:hypothetical protein
MDGSGGYCSGRAKKEVIRRIVPSISDGEATGGTSEGEIGSGLVRIPGRRRCIAEKGDREKVLKLTFVRAGS